EALLRAPFKAVRDQPPQLRRNSHSRNAEVHRIVSQNGRQSLRRRRAPEGSPARAHLIEDASERKEVAAGTRLSATHLLRRHVSHCAHGGPFRSYGVRNSFFAAGFG